MHNRDSATSTCGCRFTVRHLVSRAQVGVVVYSLLVFGTALEPPLLVVEGVVGGVRYFHGVQSALHAWEQRRDSQRVQSSFRTCPLSFLAPAPPV